MWLGGIADNQACKIHFLVLISDKSSVLSPDPVFVLLRTTQLVLKPALTQTQYILVNILLCRSVIFLHEKTKGLI